MLEESQELPDTDRRLLEIIHSQCTRMNGIVQNILGLARQESSQTESVELVAFTRGFVHDYRESHPLETDVLRRRRRRHARRRPWSTRSTCTRC